MIKKKDYGGVGTPIDQLLVGAPAKPVVQQDDQQQANEGNQQGPTTATAGSDDASAGGAQNNGTEDNAANDRGGLVANIGNSTAGQLDGAVGNGAPNDYRKDLIGYTDQIARLVKERDRYDRENETPEQQAKREKREKSQRLIAAIGDGLRSLSNLYFTSQYAPNAYNAKDSMLAKEDARLEKLKAEREANRDKYLQYALKIGDLENKRTATERAMKEQDERMKMAQGAAQRAAEKHQWEKDQQPDKQREQKGKADAAESVAKTKHIEAGHAQRYYDARNETQEEKAATERARQGSLHASANASNARAIATKKKSSGGKSGRSGKKSENTVTTRTDTYDKHGKFKGSKVTTKTTGGRKSTGVKWQ